MRRRTFLELVAAAPLAALVPWRPPAAATAGIDWGLGDDATVLVLSAITSAGDGAPVRAYVAGSIWPGERLTRVEFTGDAAVLYVASDDPGFDRVARAGSLSVLFRWRQVGLLRGVLRDVVVTRHRGSPLTWEAGERILAVEAFALQARLSRTGDGERILAVDRPFMARSV